ncbi:MAG TPA: hypothetical protein VHM30_14545 [Gemmatimonadaceae bacterium]|nr:hypothetical protein [Gemmatimonadaceae bacterium]
MQRRLLAVAALAALAVAAPQRARAACDITRLKAGMEECNEFWGESNLLRATMLGLCYTGYLALCELS